MFGVAVLMLLTLGCGLSVNDGKLSVPLTFNEETLKNLISGVQSAAANSGTDLPVEVQDLEFIEPDTVQVTGTFTTSTGQQISGDVDVKITVENGAPKVAVTGSNIPGLDPSSEAMQNISASLSQMLNDQIESAGQGGTVKSIVVEDDALKVTLEVPLSQP